MSKYLIDSDIIIWFLRGRPEMVGLLKNIQAQDWPAVSVISLAEVERGVKKGEEDITFSFLDCLNVLSVDKQLAREAARLLREQKAKGVIISLADGLVAATALKYDLTLITLNVKHFPFQALKLYRNYRS